MSHSRFAAPLPIQLASSFVCPTPGISRGGGNHPARRRRLHAVLGVPCHCRSLLDRRGWYTPFRGLLERVRKLNEPWLAARGSTKAHPIGHRVCHEVLRKRWRWRVGYKAEWHDHAWIARSRGYFRTSGGGKEQRIQVVLLERRVDAVGGSHAKILVAVCLVAGAIACHVHFVSEVKPVLAILDGACAAVRQIPLPQLR